MHDLFDPRDREKQKRISQMIDSINQKNGTNCIKLAAQGVGKADWNLRRDFLSKCPSTKIGDIIEIRG
jgi:DNA polymerase V